MKRSNEGYGEVFLVAQDDVVATVHVEGRGAVWSVSVFEVALPGSTVVNVGRGFPVNGLLSEARRQGTEAAVEQIAAALHRDRDHGGPVLRVVAKERTGQPLGYDGYIEAVDRAWDVTDHLLVTMVGRDHQTLREAIDLARRGLARIDGVDAEGKLVK
ncbi:hypothetical protein [Stenotrophomonas hibiscicola]|uniref:hypothetical protein n=1 Tax=Stenotrophomonas hibiscicola TaxID=86189 RepID=UPI002E7898C7|nr:hypothetical protein [[Pseudomonas] hibiscicola]